VVKVERSSWGFLAEVCRSGVVVFLVSILRWNKPPHHVKVNPLGEVLIISSSEMSLSSTALVDTVMGSGVVVSA
jgi:hypothetical protein